MYLLYIPCHTAPVSRFFSTGVEGTIIFYLGEIERKFVISVLSGIDRKVNFNLLLSYETIRNRIWNSFKEQQARIFFFPESSLIILINYVAWDFTGVLDSK